MTRYSPEVRARAVRMVNEYQSDYPSEWTKIQAVLCVMLYDQYKTPFSRSSVAPRGSIPAEMKKR